MRDNLVGGAVAGVIGGLAEMATGFLLIITGLARVTTLHAAIRFMTPTGAEPGPLTIVSGIIHHLTMSAVLGVVLLYILKLTGTDYYLLKGFGFALVVYVFLTRGLGVFFVPRDLLVPDALTQFAGIISHVVGGLVTAFVVASFSPEQLRS
ncbi:MAG: hypothetical protein AB1445_04590 [Bacillota bacterium]